MGNIANERFRTGNRVRLFARGEGVPKLLGLGVVGPIGDATSADFGVDLGLQPVHVIGDPKPQEHVDGRYSFTVTLSSVQLASREAADIINAGEITIETVDRCNNKPVASARGCKLANGRLTVPANSLLVRNLSFMALDIES